MDHKLFWPLQAECTNALNLAHSGLTLFENFKDPRPHSAGVFSCLALSAEKLLKLTLDVHRLNAGEPWPTVKEMKAYGHNVLELDAAARTVLRENLGNATHQPVVVGWIAKVDENPWLPDILEVLSDYGSGGRFHELNMLAGVGREQQSPSDAWLDVENKVMELHPETFQLPIEDWGSSVRNRVDHAFRNWWTLYSRSWVQGVFGADAKQMSGELEIGLRGNKDKQHR